MKVALCMFQGSKIYFAPLFFNFPTVESKSLTVYFCREIRI